MCWRNRRPSAEREDNMKTAIRASYGNCPSDYAPRNCACGYIYKNKSNIVTIGAKLNAHTEKIAMPMYTKLTTWRTISTSNTFAKRFPDHCGCWNWSCWINIDLRVGNILRVRLTLIVIETKSSARTGF